MINHKSKIISQKLKVVIAAIVFAVLSTLLIGCSKEEQVTSPVALHESAPVGIKRIKQARQIIKDVDLVFSSEEKEDQVIVDIFIENPSQKSITSLQIWLAFNPDSLKGKEFDISDSPFDLMAPYENGFDDENGLFKLGRSTPQPVHSKEIHVAKLVFEKLTEGVTMIDVYDYRTDLSGHTSVNMMSDGIPYNVLKKPEGPVLIIN